MENTNSEQIDPYIDPYIEIPVIPKLSSFTIGEMYLARKYVSFTSIYNMLEEINARISKFDESSYSELKQIASILSSIIYNFGGKIITYQKIQKE